MKAEIGAKVTNAKGQIGTVTSIQTNRKAGKFTTGREVRDRDNFYITVEFPNALIRKTVKQAIACGWVVGA